MATADLADSCALEPRSTKSTDGTVIPATEAVFCTSQPRLNSASTLPVPVPVPDPVQYQHCHGVHSTEAQLNGCWSRKMMLGLPRIKNQTLYIQTSFSRFLSCLHTLLETYTPGE